MTATAAARCRSCRAPIVWAQTVNGDAMPVNAAPDAGGNVMLGLERGQLKAHTLKRGQAAGARAAGRELYRSHFADCPDAKHHRRPR